MQNDSNLSASELVLNPDGSIYHLQLQPEQLAQTVITVGDPDRVGEVSKYFDSIEHRVTHREFITHTGTLNGKRLSVISTGIGTGNIDIVLNELDALVNIDFATRTVHKELKTLDIIRLGTSGSLHEKIKVDSILVSEFAIGMDALMDFYTLNYSAEETALLYSLTDYLEDKSIALNPYVSSANKELMLQLSQGVFHGTTLTAPGFFAPQGRQLRGQMQFPNFIELLQSFHHFSHSITNLEMETAAIYSLGKLLGHRCISFNAILANRVNHTFSSNPASVIEKMILQVLENLTRA